MRSETEMGSSFGGSSTGPSASFALTSVEREAILAIDPPTEGGVCLISGMGYALLSVYRNRPEMICQGGSVG